MINVALVGAGRIGRVHLESLTTKCANDVNLHTICDGVAPDLEELATAHKAKAVRDLEDVLKNPEIDALVICTPTDTHFNVIQRGLSAGKHVFCEKPISQSLRETLDVAELAEKHKKVFLVGYNRRFDLNYRKAQEIVTSGKIGQLQVLHATNYDYPGAPLEYLMDCGGIFMDQVLHDLDLLRFYTQSEPEVVSAMGNANAFPELRTIGDADVVNCIVQFKSGVIGSVDCSRFATYGYDQRIEALGTKGGVWSENKTTDNIRYSTSGGTLSDNPMPGFLTRYMDSYANEIVSFVNSIVNNTPSEMDALEAIYSLKMAAACKLSLKEKRMVEISEIKP